MNAYQRCLNPVIYFVQNVSKACDVYKHVESRKWMIDHIVWMLLLIMFDLAKNKTNVMKKYPWTQTVLTQPNINVSDNIVLYS